MEERNIKLIRLWFTDVLGQLKSVAISPVELETAFEEGMHFDGSAIDGFSRIQESDVLAKPDPATFEVMPWADRGTTARMFCDIFDHGGTPFSGDPRQVLRRNLAKAHQAGYSFFVAPEMEFFYFADGEPSHSPTLLDSGSYFDLTTSDVASDLRRETISVLETMGIPVEYSFHEDSPSQHEIDLRYTDAMSMADQVMTFRLVVRELALERGRFASFMPKPLEGMQGSGMHLHLSLFRDGENAFHDPDAPGSLSAHRAPLHGRAPGPRPRDHGHHQPAGQLLQAAGGRVRGPGVGVVGHQQPLRPDPGAGDQARQDHLDSGRVPLPRPRLQPLSGLLGAAGGGDEGHRGGLRPPPGDDREHLRAQTPGRWRPRGSSPCPRACRTPST